jgi:enoyl-CoA hydratase
MELALTGETFDAERGAELGLVNRLAEPGQALETALALAGEIAANAPLALRASKTVLRQQWSWDDETFWAKQGEIVGPVFTSEDAIEGATAFSEKRDPDWRGR